MRLLAVDLGDKRTGLASGDTQTGMVFPLDVLHIDRGPSLLEAIAAAASEHAAQAIVLGLPRNMDDTEGPRAILTRAFGEELAARTGLEIHYQDERLTSFEAQARLRGTSGGPGADAMAALILLEEFIAGDLGREFTGG